MKNKNRGKYRYIRITKLQQEEAKGRVLEIVVNQFKEEMLKKYEKKITTSR